MSHGFINTRHEQLFPIVDKLLADAKINKQDCADQTTVTVWRAAESFLQLIETKKVRFNADYVIFRGESFVTHEAYCHLDVKITAIDQVPLKLKWLDRVKLAIRVYKTVK